MNAALIHICDACGGRFKKPATRTEKPEYDGGTAWTFEVSPCCGEGFVSEARS